MYISLPELADYLGLPLAYIKGQVASGNIKAIHNGEEYVVSKNHFESYKKQIELKRKAIELELNEPIPEDWDAKDED
ncbi:helix-turn-helix domain-containing protein [Alkalicoccobacillus plakortidis]|uniref:Helix-turn-helix domain-containing protein n=1 Tax=Alkalicoccobacillus plakortidis TaxID=444060 RepID=A0ABT0XGQ1_9BACI|nr:helix-turn-helix domain-containing protein [Alkalicoccobacillus plakortidis]MCM2675062.1 helix-turn-helix domain-containing protein [Alkalicoccobacillus plakortidis]